MRGGREGLVLGANSAVHLHPGMLVEVAADQIAVFGPVVISVGRAMRAQEALAIVAHEGEKIRLLLIGEAQVASGVEPYGVEIIQVLRIVSEFGLGEEFGVGADVSVPQAGLAAQLFDGGHGVRDGIVFVSFHLADHQQLLGGRLSLCGSTGGEQQTDEGGQGFRFHGAPYSTHDDTPWRGVLRGGGGWLAARRWRLQAQGTQGRYQKQDYGDLQRARRQDGDESHYGERAHRRRSEAASLQNQREKEKTVGNGVVRDDENAARQHGGQGQLQRGFAIDEVHQERNHNGRGAPDGMAVKQAVEGVHIAESRTPARVTQSVPVGRQATGAVGHQRDSQQQGDGAGSGSNGSPQLAPQHHQGQQHKYSPGAEWPDR